MKYIFFLIAIFSFFGASAQEGYFLTKEQQEQIKINLRDYKVLLIKYDVRNKEFEALKSEFALLKKLHTDLQIENDELRLKSINAHNMEIKIQNLEDQIIKLNEANQSQKREIDNKTRLAGHFQKKYQREFDSNLGDRIIGNTVLGTFVAGALLAIYISINEHQH